MESVLLVLKQPFLDSPESLHISVVKCSEHSVSGTLFCSMDGVSFLATCLVSFDFFHALDLLQPSASGFVLILSGMLIRLIIFWVCAHFCYSSTRWRPTLGFATTSFVCCNYFITRGCTYFTFVPNSPLGCTRTRGGSKNSYSYLQFYIWSKDSVSTLFFLLNYLHCAWALGRNGLGSPMIYAEQWYKVQKPQPAETWKTQVGIKAHGCQECLDLPS